MTRSPPNSDAETPLLTITLWFPIEEPTDKKVGFEDLLVGLKARYSYLPIPGGVLNNLNHSTTVATYSSSVVDEKLPVFVYNHGGGSYPEDNRVLLEELASNGYIVLSIGHPLSSSAIRYPNGSVVHADFNAYGRTSLTYEEQVQLNDLWNRTFTVDSFEEYFEQIGEYILAPTSVRLIIE